MAQNCVARPCTGGLCEIGLRTCRRKLQLTRYDHELASSVMLLLNYCRLTVAQTWGLLCICNKVVGRDTYGEMWR